jgi:carbon-monoxide dehydrogenase large subunit
MAKPTARPSQREAWRLVRGQGRFIADVAVPGLCHVVFVRSPHPHARVLAIDAAEAAAVSGVVDVITGRSFEAPMAIRGQSQFALPDRPVLPTDVVRYEGEPVAAVVASDPYAAEEAARLVSVKYEPLAAAGDAIAASQPGATLVHPEFGTNLLITKHFDSGDVDSASADCAFRIRRRFRVHRGIGEPIEGRGLTVAPDNVTGGLRLWMCSQIPYLARSMLAELLGLSEAQLEVTISDIGGGFGTKNGLASEEVVVAWAARTLGRPCRWLETREESLLTASHGHDHVYEIEVAANERGEPVAVSADIYVDVGAYSHWPWSAALEPIQAGGMLLGPYKVQDYRCRTFGVMTNKAPVGPLRGVARPSATFAFERILDELADAAGADPLDLRRRIVVQPGEFPYNTSTKLVIEDGSFVESLDRVAELLDYQDWRRRQAEARKDGRYIGIGLACSIELGGIGSAMPVSPGMDMRPGTEGVTVRIEPDGTITVIAAIPSIGQNPESMFVRIIERELGVPGDMVSVIRDNTAAGSYSMGVFAGRGAIIFGGAAAEAARQLRAKMLDITGHVLSVPAGDLDMIEGEVRARDGEARLSLVEVARIAYFNAHKLPAGVEPGLVATRFVDPRFGVFANAAYGTVVEVDPELFTVKILHHAVVTDCGEMINPATVAAQVVGGVTYGVGLALTERIIYDGDGCLVFPRDRHYPLAQAVDVPEIVYDFICTPADNATGAKPAGQSSTIATPAAVANAVSDALRPLGITVTELPVTPESLFRQLDDAAMESAS